jgi:Short C-terminal domain
MSETEASQTATSSTQSSERAPTTGNSKKRKLGIGALVFFGSLLLCVAIFATWVDRVALDSGNWTDTSTKVLEQPAVRTALSQYLVDQAYANVDVPAVLETALPPRAKPLAGPIATYIEPYLQRAVAAGLERPRLVALWRAANLRAHSQLMNILNGGSGVFTTTNGTVVLALGPMVSNFSTQLSQRTNGAITLPPGTGNIVLIKSDQLSTAQKIVKLMRLASIPLALAALALLGIAIAISRERRKTLRAIGIGVLLAGLVLIFIRRVVGDVLVNALASDPTNRDAGHAIWWVATEKLASANITTITVGLLLLIGAWFAGPGRRATTSRGNLTPYLRDPAIAYGTYAVIVLVLLVWAPVEAARDATTAIILIVLGAIGVEALRRVSVGDFPDRTERDLGPRIGAWWTARRDRSSQQPAAAPAESGKYVDLERLASLHDRGVLTDAEFDAQKSALLKA